jgi:hypothetical protein
VLLAAFGVDENVVAPEVVATALGGDLPSALAELGEGLAHLGEVLGLLVSMEHLGLVEVDALGVLLVVLRRRLALALALLLEDVEPLLVDQGDPGGVLSVSNRICSTSRDTTYLSVSERI